MKSANFEERNDFVCFSEKKIDRNAPIGDHFLFNNKMKKFIVVRCRGR